MPETLSRRQFLTVSSGALALSPLVLGAGGAPDGSQGPPLLGPGEKVADVNATEDLMREHGVLRRVLLVYDEGVRRLALRDAPIVPINAAAALIQRFIEGYHEKLEEKFVFPRFARHATLGPLVKTLLDQHVAGRRLTAGILAQTQTPPRGQSERSALSRQLTAFVRMYAPHANREDTELFPAFHGLYGEKAFDALGDQFEDEEHKLLGEKGFEGAVVEVSQIEAQLGIGELADVTPK
jgi:hemerythrin-like domain-containing protein